MYNLKGKNVLITGAEKGLGFAMARGLAQAGANIVVLGRSSKKEIQTEVEALGSRFLGINIDLTDFDKLDPAIDQALKEMGQIDILVNNAGITPINKAEDYSLEEYESVMDLNLKSVFLLTKKIANHMIDQGGGRIINIGSIQSIIGGNDVSAYVASKHAIGGFTKAWANEWGKYGINVNAIAPGFMMTKNTAKLRSNKPAKEAIDNRIPLKRWGNPEDLVGPVVFLASSMSDYVNGHILTVDGGYINN